VRISFLQVVVVALLGSFGRAGFAESAIDYWPMKPGNTWQLVISVGEKRVSQNVIVTKVTTIARGNEATLEYSIDGKVNQTEVYRRTAAGLYRVKAGPGSGGTISPPFPQLIYPIAAGKKWKWKGFINTQGTSIPAESELTVSGPTTVKTPAGTFRAIKIHSELVVGAKGQMQANLPNDYWFAPNVGLVQQRLPAGAQTIEGTLQSYKLK
jgi:hypothetical protein